VVRQNAREVTGGVREERIESARRERREGLIGGGKDREGPLALERVDQPGRRERGGKSGDPAATAVSTTSFSIIASGLSVYIGVSTVVAADVAVSAESVLLHAAVVANARARTATSEKWRRIGMSFQ